jgi:hypothetical protein
VPVTPTHIAGMDRAGPSRTYVSEPEQITRTPVVTSRHAMSPFIVSTILPGFLFLGPEIANNEDIAVLRTMGVKRILNVAMDCEDGAGMGLRETFERYLKIPLRDTVEESGVGKGMRDSCDFLGEFWVTQGARARLTEQTTHDFTTRQPMSTVELASPAQSRSFSRTSSTRTRGPSRLRMRTLPNAAKAYRPTSASSPSSCSSKRPNWA